MRTATCKLYNRSLRAKLKLRSKPYFTSVSPGLSVGYNPRGAGRPGAWIARQQIGERLFSAAGSSSRYRTKQLGMADDLATMPADGATVLTFDQAVAAARAFAVDTVAGPKPTALTIREAVNSYVEFLEQRDGADAARFTVGKLRQWVLADVIADTAVNDVTLAQLQRWQMAMVRRDPNNADVERRSKDSANRVMTCLRAALNRSFDHRSETGVVNCDAWGKSFKQFRNVAAPRTRHFTPDQVRQLIEAAAPDFAAVIKTAFFTGARPGELCQLRAGDFKAFEKQLVIRDGKTGPRTVTLTSEAVAFFATLVREKTPNAPLLVQETGEPWDTDSVQPFMQRAVVDAGWCTRAELSALPRRERPTLYTLRHSYASRAIENGMSLLILAQNLGNSVAMLERNYVKILDAKRRELIEAHAPSLNVASHG